MSLLSAPAKRRIIRRKGLSNLPVRPDGKKTTGYLLFEDSDRIVIATGLDSSSSNSKTGGMVQVWILVKHCNPLQAIKRMFDYLVCGTCKHMGSTDPITGKRTKRSCYVRMDTAPLSVWNGWTRGIYPYLPESMYAQVFAGRIVRWGAYGDPKYIPISIIAAISDLATAHTGYTHQWQLPEAQVMRPFIMASVDTLAEFQQAQSMGWRTFRVSSAFETKQTNEVTCPASIEATRARQDRYATAMHSKGIQGPAAPCKVTCEDCVLCDGAAGKSLKSIVIRAHGAGKSAFDLIQIGVN